MNRLETCITSPMCMSALLYVQAWVLGLCFHGVNNQKMKEKKTLPTFSLSVTVRRGAKSYALPKCWTVILALKLIGV